MGTFPAQAVIKTPRAHHSPAEPVLLGSYRNLNAMAAKEIEEMENLVAFLALCVPNAIAICSLSNVWNKRNFVFSFFNIQFRCDVINTFQKDIFNQR